MNSLCTSGIIGNLTFYISIFVILKAAFAEETVANESDENQVGEAGRLEQLLDEITASRGLEVRSVTREEIERVSPELLKWTPPESLSRNFPVYFSGYDDDLRPLWIAEYGKWDLRRIVSGGQEVRREFRKYILALTAHIYKSMNDSTPPGSPLNDFNMILDLEGFKTEYMTVPAIQYAISLALLYRQVIVNHMSDMVGINVNAVAQLAIDIGRPIIFSILADRMEVYGTRRETWVAALRKKYPLEIIPTWYGGAANYKPAFILG